MSATSCGCARPIVKGMPLGLTPSLLIVCSSVSTMSRRRIADIRDGIIGSRKGMFGCATSGSRALRGRNPLSPPFSMLAQSSASVLVRGHTYRDERVCEGPGRSEASAVSGERRRPQVRPEDSSCPSSDRRNTRDPASPGTSASVATRGGYACLPCPRKGSPCLR